MSAEKAGVQEFKQCIDLTLAVVALGLDVAKDGKVGLDDLGSVVKVLPFIAPAVEGMGQIPAELWDLSGEEVSELVSHVVVTLAVDDVKAKLILEKSLKVLASGFELFKAIQA